MNKLAGKKILVGVTGSISAYKIPLLIRELVRAGASVRVLMTDAAKHFVTKDVLANLSRSTVIDDMFDEKEQSDGAWHIHLAHDADLYIIAPCSAATLGKLAGGICDNAVTAMAIAMPRNIPVLIAPAMDTTMWENPITQENARKLEETGWEIIPPEAGELSSGIIGPGRLPEPGSLAEIISKKLGTSVWENGFDEMADTYEEKISADRLNAEIELEELKRRNNPLFGKKLLISAGPTIEKIDDVRYISNFSSGKMGYALAAEAKRRGAEVTLVSGPVNLTAPEGVSIVSVVSAEEMYREVISRAPESKVMIMAAAVADFSPASRHKGKMKKGELPEGLSLEMSRTKDILAELGNTKSDGQVLVGFALESEDEVENARQKLHAKNCDMIVLNSAKKADSGFGGDNNTITLLTRDGSITDYPTMSKEKCSVIILDRITDSFL